MLRKAIDSLFKVYQIDESRSILLAGCFPRVCEVGRGENARTSQPQTLRWSEGGGFGRGENEAGRLRETRIVRECWIYMDLLTRGGRRAMRACASSNNSDSEKRAREEVTVTGGSEKALSEEPKKKKLKK